jgi:lipoprotein LprG
MRLVALFATLIIALITSCGASGEQKTAGLPSPIAPTLPNGATLLTASAAAMRTVTTARFVVDVQGDAPTVQFRSAEGQLTREGSAKGTAKLDEGRQILELPFVIIGQTLYLHPPTGLVERLPASVLSEYFDPRAILDPDRGLASVLTSGQGATTKDREQVDGVDSYRVTVTFPPQPLHTLAPGLRLTPDKPSEIWVAAQGSRLLKAQVPTAYGTATVQLSDFDAPAEITPPADSDLHR